jgi:hypothetical protein
MTALLIGAFGCIVVFSLLLILLVQHAITGYEKEKLDTLTRQIKQKNGADILTKVIAKRAFTTFDLNASIKKSKQIAAEFLQKTVGAVKKIGSPVQVAKNAARGVEQLFVPITPEQTTPTATPPPATPEPEKKTDSPTAPHHPEYQKDVDKIVARHSTDTATLNIVAEKTTSSSPAFAKLEHRILTQLQESGMQNYDIWLQLGQLYVKFDEAEKAKEVFALVLKHSPAGSKLKETARNGLIGLGT